MDDERQCIQCGRSLENRRPGTLFHSQRCKRKYYRSRAGSNYPEPPSPRTATVTESRAMPAGGPCMPTRRSARGPSVVRAQPAGQAAQEPRATFAGASVDHAGPRDGAPPHASRGSRQPYQGGGPVRPGHHRQRTAPGTAEPPGQQASASTSRPARAASSVSSIRATSMGRRTTGDQRAIPEHATVGDVDLVQPASPGTSSTHPPSRVHIRKCQVTVMDIGMAITGKWRKTTSHEHHCHSLEWHASRASR